MQHNNEDVRPTVALTSNDLHVWLDCSCGWQVDLGDAPSPWDATKQAEMHLYRAHPSSPRKRMVHTGQEYQDYGR